MNDQRSGPRSGLILPFAAALWFLVFTLYFFRQGLPNASATRADVWAQSPWLILDSLLPPVPEPRDTAPSSSGWRFIGQRIDKVAWAALVLMGAWHLGSLILRSVLRGRSLSPPPATGLHFALAGRLIRTASPSKHPGDRPIEEYLDLARRTGFELVERRGIFPTVPVLTRAIRKSPARLAPLHRLLTRLLPVPGWCFLNVLLFTRR